MRSARVSSLLLVLSGCADLLGADFDRRDRYGAPADPSSSSFEPISEDSGPLDPEVDSDAQSEARADGGAKSSKPDAAKESGTNVPSCAPKDVTSLTRPWKPPAPLHQNKCSSSQLDTFIDCATGALSQSYCDSFVDEALNTECVQCLVPPSSSATSGAFQIVHSTILANVPGCIARHEGDLSATGCGAKYNRLDDCMMQACRYCSSETRMDCLLAAAESGGTCGAYANVSCANGLLGDGDPCDRSSGYADGLRSFGRLFCMP